jgi:hypothetical protein
MSCINCEKIRAAILHGKMADALGLTVDMFREKMGLSVEGEPLIDAATLPSLSGKTKAELLAIAADEKVDVEEGATNADIIDAIATKRELVAA